MQNDISLKYEFFRKLIHLSTAIIPLTYYFYLKPDTAIIVCGFIFGVFLFADILRIYITHLTQFYEKYLDKLLRPDEKGSKLNGATLLFMGFFISVFLFDKLIAVIVMLFLSVADSLAAVIGKSIGSIKYFGKTLEGSITFFGVSFLIAWSFNINLATSAIVAAIATLAEALPVNDNITIPLAGGFSFFIAKFVL